MSGSVGFLFTANYAQGGPTFDFGLSKPPKTCIYEVDTGDVFAFDVDMGEEYGHWTFSISPHGDELWALEDSELVLQRFTLP